MLKTISISLATIIILFLIIWTSLAFFSMYRTHHMDEITFEPLESDYWPTKKWQTSTPEEQGMDSEKLIEMVEEYQKTHQENKEIIIDSMTIIRNNRIVADMYFNSQYPKNTKHIINSCTKSIMSALIGIAIEQGHIKNVDVPIIEILNDKKIKNPDQRLKDISIKNLLAMQTGLNSQDSYLYRWKGLFEMQMTDDWTEYILNLNTKTEPGTRFDYSNHASFLLSAIITKTTGTDTHTYARENLFKPLGINDVFWEKSPQGIYHGFARMWLKPHDMAKFGMLYLQKGQWDGQQIVPKKWIEESIKAHSFPKQYRYIYNHDGKINFNLSGASWVSTNFMRPLADGYGYQWWLDESGMFAAVGVGGQYIVIVPDKNLVVVITSKLKGKNSFLPINLLKKYILPSIQTDKPLTPNKKTQSLLDSYASPPPEKKNKKPIPILPENAKTITNKTYSLNQSIENNPWQYNSFKFIFDENKDYAELNYKMNKDDQIQLQIGLDNIYRYSESFRGTYAARGKWINNNTFEVEYELIGYASKGKWRFVFENDSITVKEGGVTGMYEYKGTMNKNKN